MIIHRYIYVGTVTKSMYTMSMGAYDEDEHERREEKASTVDAEFDDQRTEYRGEVEFDSGDSAEDLLDQFQEMKGK